MSGSRVYSRQGIGTLNLLQDPYTAKGDLLVGASSFFGVGLWTIFPPGPSNSVLSTTAPRTLAWVSTASTLIGNTGDLITFSGPNVEQNLAIGTLGQLLRSTGTLPAWVNPNSILTGTKGDLLYINPNNTIANLPIGGVNNVLTSDGAVPRWAFVAAPPIVRCYWTASATSLLTTGTVFLPMSGIEDSSGLLAESAAHQIICNHAVFFNAFGKLVTAPGVGNSRTFTARLNGVSQPTSFIISGNNTTGNNITDNFAANQGDLLDWKCDVGGVPAATLGVTLGIQLEPITT